MNAGAALQVLTEARVLADIDRFFAQSLAALGAGPEVVLAAAAVSALHRAGHTCLPLSEAGKPLADIVERPSSEHGEEVPARARAVRLPAGDAWRGRAGGQPGSRERRRAQQPASRGPGPRPPTTSVGAGP